VADLEAAAERGMLPALSPLGYGIVEASASYRGAAVRLCNGRASIEITADWLEGEIHVDAGPIGQPSVPLGQLVDMGESHGLHLARLPRPVSTAVVADQLAQVAGLLLRHQASLLAAD
jgi:hypothetical protein